MRVAWRGDLKWQFNLIADGAQRNVAAVVPAVEPDLSDTGVGRIASCFEGVADGGHRQDAAAIGHRGPA